MYDDIAKLKKYSDEIYDEYGNPIQTIVETTIYVQPRSVYASEFYQAAQLGIKPSITLDITNRADYDGQKVVEFQGDEYNVVRVDWNAQRDKVSLVCEPRIGNEEGGGSE